MANTKYDQKYWNGTAVSIVVNSLFIATCLIIGLLGSKVEELAEGSIVILPFIAFGLLLLPFWILVTIWTIMSYDDLPSSTKKYRVGGFLASLGAAALTFAIIVFG